MSIVEEIKNRFANDNAISKIIFLNVVVFLFFGIAQVLFFLFGLNNPLIEIKSWFYLYASFDNFIYKPWGILTYMFLHDGFFHILFNMLWLYWLGGLLQEYLGNSKTYQAYFLGGIFGGLIYIISYNIFPVFQNSLPISFALGASAGVLSVLVAAATLLPDYPIMLLFFGEVRLKFIAIFSVLLDIINIPSGNAGGHIAHLGGALFGYLFIKFIYSKSNMPNALDKIFDGIFSIFKTKSKMKVHYKNNTTNMNSIANRKTNQHDVDAILDKISKSSYESLSQKEKEILFKASKD